MTITKYTRPQEPHNSVTVIRLKKHIFNAWNEPKDINSFPGPLPVSLNRADFAKLEKYQYNVSVKTDGTRAILVSYKGTAYFVTRKYEFYRLNYNPFEIKSHRKDLDYLVDGELMENGVYVIHDLASYGFLENDEWCFSSRNFSVRHSAILEILKTLKKVKPEEFPPLEIVSKKYYSLKDIAKLESSDLKNDGLILIPETRPIGTYTQFNLYKWKSIHTFDFVVCMEDNRYVFYVTEHIGRPNRCYADMNTHCKEGKEFTRLLKENCPGWESGDIVECYCNKDATMYYPKTLRKDKTLPNSLMTIERTILNVIENITFEELVQTFGKE
jgi:hypothetical protein